MNIKKRYLLKFQGTRNSDELMDREKWCIHLLKESIYVILKKKDNFVWKNVNNIILFLDRIKIFRTDVDIFIEFLNTEWKDVS